MAIIDKLKKIVADELAVDESEVVEEAHLLDDLDADSMNLMVIYAEVEKIFGVVVDDDTALDIETVRDLVNHIKKEGE